MSPARPPTAIKILSRDSHYKRDVSVSATIQAHRAPSFSLDTLLLLFTIISTHSLMVGA